MLIGIGASIYSGNRYDAAISSASLAARFDAALGITSSGGFASAWADQSGNGRNLLQATGANQPIHLPFAGAKYGYLPGVAGNYFSTPDSAANSITGDIAVVLDMSANDLTNGNQSPLGKIETTTTRSYFTQIDGAGTPSFSNSTDGTAGTQVTGLATATLGSVGITDGQRFKLAFTLDVDNGAGGRVNKFFYSTDGGETWPQLGATVTTAGTTSIFNSNSIVEIGGLLAGTAQLFAGKVYSAQIYNGIPPIFGGSGSASPVVDFDPSRWTSGTTFTAATGETWTINSTGSKPAQIVDRPSLLFDGAAHCMKTDPFTLNQPETVYLVAKQVSWTNQDYFFDGVTSNTGVLFQNNATPQLSIYAGNLVGADANLQVGVAGVIGVVFNGATSSLQVNGNAAATGNAGASNMGGITLGANGSAPGVVNNLSNIQAYEVLIYNVAHDAATRSNIIRALMSKHGVA